MTRRDARTSNGPPAEASAAGGTPDTTPPAPALNDPVEIQARLTRLRWAITRDHDAFAEAITLASRRILPFLSDDSVARPDVRLRAADCVSPVDRSKHRPRGYVIVLPHVSPNAKDIMFLDEQGRLFTATRCGTGSMAHEFRLWDATSPIPARAVLLALEEIGDLMEATLQGLERQMFGEESAYQHRSAVNHIAGMIRAELL
jgi:hypothetical protein